MESLTKMLEEIHSNYNVKFIIERNKFETDKPIYRLKQRKPFKLLWKIKYFDEYELNALSYKINFKSLKEIETYLRFRYSESEGFKTESFDLNYNSTDISEE